MVITIAVALISSSGIWGLFSLALKKKNDTTKLMIGVAQHLIVRESVRLLEQGYMSTDDYKNVNKGLYEPYKQLGGNGLAEKMMSDVSNLPIVRRNNNAPTPTE